MPILQSKPAAELKSGHKNPGNPHHRIAFKQAAALVQLALTVLGPRNFHELPSVASSEKYIRDSKRSNLFGFRLLELPKKVATENRGSGRYENLKYILSRLFPL